MTKASHAPSTLTTTKLSRQTIQRVLRGRLTSWGAGLVSWRTESGSFPDDDKQLPALHLAASIRLTLLVEHSGCRSQNADSADSAIWLDMGAYFVTAESGMKTDGSTSIALVINRFNYHRTRETGRCGVIISQCVNWHVSWTILWLLSMFALGYNLLGMNMCLSPYWTVIPSPLFFRVRRIFLWASMHVAGYSLIPPLTMISVKITGAFRVSDRLVKKEIISQTEYFLTIS